MDLFLYVLRSIVALLIVIWVANVLLKYVNQHMNKQTRTMQIIERITVSKSSSLAIVKIINQYYLMSFTEDTSEILREFTHEEIEEMEKPFNKQEEVESKASLNKIGFSYLKEKYKHFFEQKK